MRITGGQFRSRLLVAPRGAATRPTSDRVRESLFSILEARGFPRDARVLDLFAGTGSLGFEALSRGADHVTFVEERRDTLRALEENRAALKTADRTAVFAEKVERALTRLPAASFDLVFLDPPYKLVTETPFVALFGAVARVCAPNACVVLEHASRDEAPALGPCACEEARRYGDTALAFYAPTPADAEEILEET